MRINNPMETASALRNICLWHENIDGGERVKGDLDTFDSQMLNTYRELISWVFDSMPIPQGDKAIYNPAVELGLATKILKSETLPSTWRNGAVSIIRRATKEESLENRNLEEEKSPWKIASF